MINEKFIINLQGKSFVTYEGLLDLAHQIGLVSLEVDLVQFPSEENNMTAIARAVATTQKGRFSDIGDASPRSVNSMLAPHIIRMASTRAKARALRDLTNVGMTAVEELSMEEGVAEGEDHYGTVESPSSDPPTKRQIETIKKLADDLNKEINYDTLNKRTAGTLIGKLLEDKKK
ncbi:hypothetical protein [Tissierella creatinophila]|uniref:Uncharacterized protein n=1 Tax=Tissierella creatinophila DSM 6911 TaxID=1123403 RepID=A0A1U7M7N6_TISCR|nr:hypothetical protein [Tissierella creatinophila]OLS03296.1 hypothetical protein TICRE_07240 [Tissierella creatinophila DSM 6911]